MVIKQPKPQPGYQLRHRLTGAVIIVTVAVVIIPLLLHSPEPGQGVQVGDDGDLITEADDLTESEALISPIEPLITEPDEAQSPPEESVASTPESVVSEDDQPESDDGRIEQAAVSPTTVQQTGKALYVRVGTYVNIKNVNSISELLADNGFEARHTEVQTTNAKAVRVWLGPYYDPEKAEQARLQARALTHEKVYVTEQAP